MEQEPSKKHRPVPVIRNLIETVDLYYTKDGKETSLVAVVADLSVFGMRVISFLGVPPATRFRISLQLCSTCKMNMEARLVWVKKRENVYTMGLEFTKIAEKDSQLINTMANDFVDCETRIILESSEICIPTCKCHKICNKIQKDYELFDYDSFSSNKSYSWDSTKKRGPSWPPTSTYKIWD